MLVLILFLGSVYYKLYDHRLTWAQVVLRLELHLEVTRAPDGVENLVVMPGNNMCDGAPAQLTFRTKHPFPRVLNSPHNSVVLSDIFGMRLPRFAMRFLETGSGH